MNDIRDVSKLRVGEEVGFSKSETFGCGFSTVASVSPRRVTLSNGLKFTARGVQVGDSKSSYRFQMRLVEPESLRERLAYQKDKADRSLRIREFHELANQVRYWSDSIPDELRANLLEAVKAL